MSGFITKRAVIMNCKHIISTYGFSFFVSCLVCKNKTFLGLLVEKGKI